MLERVRLGLGAFGRFKSMHFTAGTSIAVSETSCVIMHVGGIQHISLDYRIPDDPQSIFPSSAAC